MSSRLQRKARLLAVGALALSALAASPVLAGGTTTTYKCSATPNPVTKAVTYTVSGSGFPAGMVVNLYIKDRVSTWIVYGGTVAGGTVGSTGTFSVANINASVFYPNDLGTKTVSVTNANDGKQTTLAQCTFAVQLL